MVIVPKRTCVVLTLNLKKYIFLEIFIESAIFPSEIALIFIQSEHVTRLL